MSSISVFIGSRGALVLAVAAVAVAAAAVTVPVITGGPGGGGDPTANVWIIPGASPNGSCTRSATQETRAEAEAALRVCNPADNAAGVMQAAKTAANAGDMIRVKDGDYGPQDVFGTDKAVTFEAEGPGRPEFAQIINGTDDAVWRGLKFEDREDADNDANCEGPNGIVVNCGTDNTYDDVIVDGLGEAGTPGNCPDVGIRGGGPGLTFKNSIIENMRDTKGAEVGDADQTFEGNTFRLITHHNDCNPDVHNECAYVTDAPRQTWRNNRFEWCPTMGLAFTNWIGGSAYADVVIEGNVFLHSTGSDMVDGLPWHASPCGLKMGAGTTPTQNTWDGWIVRYNTFETDPCVDHQDADPPMQWYGNLGGGACITDALYSYNVGNTCDGSNDVYVANGFNTSGSPNRSPFWVAASGGDFHLKPATAALDAGNPAAFPVTDRDGVARGNPPDAGAYEFVP